MPKINPNDFDRVLDISHYQKSVDAQKIKNAGTVGVYAKACEWFWWLGDPRHTDEEWENNATKISDAGMKLGAYEYYRSRDRKPLEQAAWFRQVVGSHPVDFVVIDVEKNELSDKVAFTKDLIKHTQEVERLFGKVPWIYTRATFFDFAVVPNLYDWQRHPLISAHYNPYMSKPWIPKAWSNHNEREVLWQITDKYIVPGILNTVDLNLVMSDRFYELLGNKPPTLEERVASLEQRVAVLEAG
jgi:GH25 family lysozyme M1 (1,4-beta-N-acetylmuramidase)